MSQAPPRLQIDKRALFHDLGYEPHPGQLEVHLSSAPRRVLACGARWGNLQAVTWPIFRASQSRFLPVAGRTDSERIARKFTRVGHVVRRGGGIHEGRRAEEDVNAARIRGTTVVVLG